MDVVYERCCGLDIYKKTVVACVISPGSNRKTQKVIRTFGTMTDDLLALADWLPEHGNTHTIGGSVQMFSAEYSIAPRSRRPGRSAARRRLADERRPEEQRQVVGELLGRPAPVIDEPVYQVG